MCLLWKLSQGTTAFSGLFRHSGRGSHFQCKGNSYYDRHARHAPPRHLTRERNICICPPDMWAAGIIHQVMCSFAPSCANNPPKNNNNKNPIIAALINHQTQESVSTEPKSGMPLLPSNSTSWRSSISSYGSCLPHFIFHTTNHGVAPSGDGRLKHRPLFARP